MNRRYFHELLKDYPNKPINSIPYSELLNTHEWKKFRDKIEKRDNYKCLHCSISSGSNEVEFNNVELELQRDKNTELHLEIEELIRDDLLIDELFISYPLDIKIQAPKCFIEKISLEVHHSYYIFQKAPWEYPENSLITLCRVCHQMEHDCKTVYVYDDENKNLVRDEFLTCIRCSGSGYLSEYDYYQNGVCFECKGWGYK